MKRWAGQGVRGVEEYDVPVAQSPTLDCLKSEYSSSLSSLEASGSCLTRSAASLKMSLRPMVAVDGGVCGGGSGREKLAGEVEGLYRARWSGKEEDD